MCVCVVGRAGWGVLFELDTQRKLDTQRTHASTHTHTPRLFELDTPRELDTQRELVTQRTHARTHTHTHTPRMHIRVGGTINLTFASLSDPVVC
jgi:hypothetical protein